MFLRTVLTFAAGACSLLAVTAAVADDPVYSGVAVKSLTATLVGTDGAPVGTVQLHQDAAGVVLVRIDVAGIPAGAHGVHLHAVGRCEGPAFASAGGHFNPGGHQHGLENPAGPHAGDLPQTPPSFSGTGTHIVTTDRVSLTSGPAWVEDADGTALIVHAAADDQVTDPTGNSGARIACAVVSAPRPVSATPPPAAATPTPVAPLPPRTGTGAPSPSGGGELGLAALVLLAGTLAARRARSR